MKAIKVRTINLFLVWPPAFARKTTKVRTLIRKKYLEVIIIRKLAIC